MYPPSGAGIAPSRVGPTFALVYAYLHSARRAPPITLRGIAVDGRGVGSVIQVEKVELVPPGAADRAVPETLYFTDPPVVKAARGGALASPVPLQVFDAMHVVATLRRG